ncbi:MAG TPA: transporter [Phnomibacter sp.]|nr:transporter [Phnomibacter sp.]
MLHRIKTAYWLPLLVVVFACKTIFAQDLDPRTYVKTPVHTTTVVSGFAYSRGGVVTDPTLPVQNIKAHVEAVSIGLAHSFNFFGLSSQALVALPYSWANVSGEVGNQQKEVHRSGLADMRLRFSVLFLGAPAATLAEMRQQKPQKTILGASINVVAPTGEFQTGKLINLGANRWAFRPELALSQAVGKRFMVDVYAGVWFFTNNNSFYPGSALRTQEPMATLQGHFSYNISPKAWVAINTTYYMGGTSAIDHTVKDDRQSNMRVGITGVIPTGPLSSLKLAASTGAVVRIGQDFSTYSIGWQRSWIQGLTTKK